MRADVVEELRFALEEAAVDEVVALDAREREGERVFAGARDELGVRRGGSSSRASHTLHAFAAALRDRRVVAGQAPVDTPR